MARRGRTLRRRILLVWCQDIPACIRSTSRYRHRPLGRRSAGFRRMGPPSTQISPSRFMGQTATIRRESAFGCRRHLRPISRVKRLSASDDGVRPRPERDGFGGSGTTSADGGNGAGLDGGGPPYSWSVAVGSTLPAGLSLSRAGTLRCLPESAQVHNQSPSRSAASTARLKVSPSPSSRELGPAAYLLIGMVAWLV